MQHPLPIVFLYDESAKILWASHVEPPYQMHEVVGQVAWHALGDHDARECQAAFIRCAAENAPQVLDVKVQHVGLWRTRIYRARITAGRVRFAGYAEKWPTQVLLLSEREREVCAALARGGRSKQAARELGLSVSTVDTHRQRISVKLGITPDTLVAWCGAHASWLQG